jgi:hypothetical protein
MPLDYRLDSKVSMAQTKNSWVQNTHTLGSNNMDLPYIDHGVVSRHNRNYIMSCLDLLKVEYRLHRNRMDGKSNYICVFYMLYPQYLPYQDYKGGRIHYYME